MVRGLKRFFVCIFLFQAASASSIVGIGQVRGHGFQWLSYLLAIFIRFSPFFLQVKEVIHPSSAASFGAAFEVVTRDRTYVLVSDLFDNYSLQHSKHRVSGILAFAHAQWRTHWRLENVEKHTSFDSQLVCLLFFRFCQSFTSNFPFSFPFLFRSLSLRPFVCA